MEILVIANNTMMIATTRISIVSQLLQGCAASCFTCTASSILFAGPARYLLKRIVVQTSDSISGCAMYQFVDDFEDDCDSGNQQAGNSGQAVDFQVLNYNISGGGEDRDLQHEPQRQEALARLRWTERFDDALLPPNGEERCGGADQETGAGSESEHDGHHDGTGRAEDHNRAPDAPDRAFVVRLVNGCHRICSTRGSARSCPRRFQAAGIRSSGIRSQRLCRGNSRCRNRP